MKQTISKAVATDLCVLLIEDNEHMRELLKRLLLAMGIKRIAEYTEGAQALSHLAEVKPDFILTDLSMTPMDGLQFTRAIRHHADELLCVTPIIMVTGHTERQRIHAARDAGVTEILAKPITTAGLYHRIDEIVHRPRPFVRAPNYCGPCRRRHSNPNFTGPWRRKSDQADSDTIASEEIAAQEAKKTARA